MLISEKNTCVVEVGVEFQGQVVRKGTGFAVAPRMILTCAHLFDHDRGGYTGRYENASVRWRVGDGHWSSPSEVHRGATYEHVLTDYALLTTVETLPFLRLMLPLKPRDPTPGATFVAGYPEKSRFSHVPMTRLRQGLVSEEKVMRLLGDAEVLHGFSGGPLVAPTRSGLVCVGMVQWGGPSHPTPSFAATGLLEEWLKGLEREVGVCWAEPETLIQDEGWIRYKMEQSLRDEDLGPFRSMRALVEYTDLSTAEGLAGALIEWARRDLLECLRGVARGVRPALRADIAGLLLLISPGPDVRVDGSIESRHEWRAEVARARADRGPVALERDGPELVATHGVRMPRTPIEPGTVRIDTLFGELARRRKSGGRALPDYITNAEEFLAHLVNSAAIVREARVEAGGSPERTMYFVDDRPVALTEVEIELINRMQLGYVRLEPGVSQPANGSAEPGKPSNEELVTNMIKMIFLGSRSGSSR